jgi:hypothetical protein
VVFWYNKGTNWLAIIPRSRYSNSEPEYLSPEDLADIQEGMEDIREGRFLALEEYRSGKRL